MNNPTAATGCTIPCNLCGSREVAELASRERSGEPLRTVICKDCGLVWTDPRPPEQEIKQFYEHEYRLRQKGIRQPKLKHIYRGAGVARDRIFQLSPFLNPGVTILDLGSGAGEIVFLLRGLGYDAIGIEPNEGYARFAKEELKLPIEIGSFKEVAITEASFDVVTLFHVFEHLEDPLGTIQRLRLLIKPGGTLVIEVPNVEATCQAPGHLWQYHHFYNYNAATLEALGRKAGYEPLQTSHSEDFGNVCVVFRKIESWTPGPGHLPGNFRRISGVITGHTEMNHYLTPAPYVRSVRRGVRSIQEWVAVKCFNSPAAMLEAAVRQTRAGLKQIRS